MTMLEDHIKLLESGPSLKGFRVLEYDNIYSKKEHIPDSHELLYVLDGRMSLHLNDGCSYRAMPGDFLLVPAGIPHRDEFAPLKGLRILFIQFTWDAENFFQTVNNRSLAVLSYEVRTEARRRLEYMRARWHNTTEDIMHASLQLHSILMLFFSELIKDSTEDNMLQNNDLPMREAMRCAKHFLEQNYGEHVSLGQTARHIGISPAYLSRIFHHEYGVSFAKFLTAIRLEASRELLQSTRLQVAEVANRCGFSSSSYFIKVFSEHYGVTPKNYAGKKGKSF